FLIGILPRLQNNTTFPWWPPDCFGLCLALLKRSGAYTQLLRDWPPDSKGAALEAWSARTRGLGEAWQKSQPKTYPGDLENEWQVVCQSFAMLLRETRNQRALCESLMNLAAVAD